jgi:uncharacterized protein (DUF2141 family)
MRITAPLAALFAAPVALGFAAGPAHAQGCTGRPSATRLNVIVENVHDSSGLIAVTVYADDSRRFLARRGSLYVGRVPARAGTTRVCIHLPRPGTWAIGVYHDSDANRTINRDSLGRPLEGFGFSNNPSTLFSIPAFRSVRLNVPHTNMETTIRLRYR